MLHRAKGEEPALGRHHREDDGLAVPERLLEEGVGGDLSGQGGVEGEGARALVLGHLEKPRLHALAAPPDVLRVKRAPQRLQPGARAPFFLGIHSRRQRAAAVKKRVPRRWAVCAASD